MQILNIKYTSNIKIKRIDLETGIFIYNIYVYINIFLRELDIN